MTAQPPLPDSSEITVGDPARATAAGQTLARRREALAAAAAKPTGRAGRNLPFAIGSALILIAIVLAALLWHIEIFIILIALFVIGGMREFVRAVKTRGIDLPYVPLATGGVGIIASTWYWGPQATLGAFFITAAASVAVRVAEDANPRTVRDASVCVLATAYIPLLGSFLVLLAARGGALAVLTALALPIANDTGGWAAGVLFGKHPIAPSISPKKSWEGAVGSLILTTVVSAVFVGILLRAPIWVTAVMALVAVVASTVGDLMESLIKRDLGVKDMGTIFPGHGGVLDRVDSILVMCPVTFLVLDFAGIW